MKLDPSPKSPSRASGPAAKRLSVELPPISPLLRAVGVFSTWGLLLLAQPGLFGRDGLGWIAFFALIPWALVASRPGKWARAIEWAGATFGLCGFAFWMRYLLDWAVFPMGAVPALYLVAGGILLRRLARRFPLALAVPMAWMAAEAVRFTLGAPFSFGWWRLGTLSHADLWFSNGARVFGVWGLSFGMAAWAGWCADCWVARTKARRGSQQEDLPKVQLADPKKWWTPLSHGFGVGAPLLMVLAGLVTSAPKMEPGPRVMVLTTGLEQALKHNSEDPFFTRIVDPFQLCADAMEATRAAGGELPDLVALGESMLLGHAVRAEVWAALEGGVNAPTYTGREWTKELLDAEQLDLDFTVRLALGLVRPYPELVEPYPGSWLEQAAQGIPPIPAGTSLFGGVTSVLVRDGHLWRKNGAHIWGPDGMPGAFASKVHLVPAAEDPYPTAYVPWLLTMIEKAGGYIPDFVTDGSAGVLPFNARDGQTYRAGTSICYDNAFDDPYTEVHGGAGVDFHLIASNEAWYKESVLMDHMLAFSRLMAIATGRSILRATNSGASALIGPEGRILELLQENGRHKMARGVLDVTVPVPERATGMAPPKTLYVRSKGWQTGLYWLFLLGLAFLAGRR